jgi:hypothetical protein
MIGEDLQIAPDDRGIGTDTRGNADGVNSD